MIGGRRTGQKGETHMHEAVRWCRGNARSIGINVLAGLAASLLALAYCLSFSALLFQAELRPGLATGLWALLMGSAISGLYVALSSSIPPVAAGPNNPAVAVLSVLATTVSGIVLGEGGSPAKAVDHVLLSFALATLATGLALYAIGAARIGQFVRFVPYPVIGGFLAASGWLLAAGGIRVVTGHELDILHPAGLLPPGMLLQVLLAILFALAVYALKSATGSMTALPIAFLVAAFLLDLVLWGLGLGEPGSGWYLAGTSEPAPWLPIALAGSGDIDWSVFLRASAEIASAAGVTIVALLLDVSGLEVTRLKTADLDWEFRTNGAANILSVPLGGVMGKLSVNGSRLIDETGGTWRLSGVAAALIVALVAMLGIDLARLVPAAVLGGVLIYIGASVLAETLLYSPARRAWSDFGLALLIMLAIVRYGYLAGVILGFIGACLMFALSYSRISVIRRHLTRAVYASSMDRSADMAERLQKDGDRIHILWLSGYIFFGSSHRLFEAICSALERTPSSGRRYAVLDFAEVSGFDTSALLSLVKLRNHAEQNGVTLAFAGLNERMGKAFARAGLFGAGRPHVSLLSRNAALEWCEEQLLAEEAGALERGQAADLEAWLAAEVGDRALARCIAACFARRVLSSGETLYRQGDAPDSIDLIVEGTVAVSLASLPGGDHVVRRMSKRTVVGEMGFFRGTPRAATVTAEKDAVVYTLSRAAYDRLIIEEPRAAGAFLEFIVRALSDRLEFVNSGIAALS
jgi:SulP family sulfate permease